MMRGMDLASAAAKLYALLPSEFTAERNRAAKAARAEGNSLLAKQIGRLPKPSTAAWAVNMLALRKPDEVAQVLELGESLRRAQEDLDPASMRELGQQRHKVLAAVVRQARALATDLGVTVSDAAATEMEATLRAAMADPDAADAVRSGHLVRTLASNGFEPVDLSGAVAVPGMLPEAPHKRAKKTADDDGERRAEQERRAEESRAEESRAEEKRREREEAQTEVDEAERAVQQAEAELSDAEHHLSEVASRRSELNQELGELRARISELEEELTAVDREAGYAERTRKLAARLAEQEHSAAKRARERLDRL
jgi:DNA repair exonuclease SbcCD ATPase subunit